MSRSQLERSGYLHSFPHLLGCVSCLHGDESDIRALIERAETDRDWVAGLSATELVLTPAACYPLYPLVAARGCAPEKGLLFDVASYCFRREASHDVDRMQTFQMREYVHVGTAEQSIAFRERWIARAKEIVKQLGLPYQIAPASDPFFGRAGRILAISQVEQALKYELLIPVRSEEQLTACMSFNYHRDHFTAIWNIRTEVGDLAHTACVAFGLDRLALALFVRHGLDLQKWPLIVREALSF
jgi:seryl-tRNA synthetase